MKPELLVRADRGNSPERFHYGFITVVDEAYNCVFKLGDDGGTAFPFRSAAKPLQATAVIDAGCVEYYGLSSKELAVICSSHTGTAEHVELVKGILAKAGLTPDNLQCGAHDPLDQAEKLRLILDEEVASSLHNNCSGKHAGMLITCVKNGWDVETYLEPNHPLQNQIMNKVRDFCHLTKVPDTVFDGCSAPIPVLPYFNMGVGFLNLFLDPRYQALKTAMLENPYLMGGEKRLDSEIIKASNGTLIAKVGAEGLCVVMNVVENKVIVVKIADAEPKMRSLVTIEMIKKLGWLNEEQIAGSSGLNALYIRAKERKNSKQQVIGDIKILF